MNIKKQDVGVWVKFSDEEPDWDYCEPEDKDFKEGDEWLKLLKDRYVLTEDELEKIFEAGEQRGLSYITGYGYENDKGNFEQFIKIATK